MTALQRRSRAPAVLVTISLLGLFDATTRQAQGQAPDNPQARLNTIPWQQGPCTAQVGSLGQVQVPAGYKYTGVEGTRTFLELTQNTPTPRDLGILCPSNWPGGADGPNAWFLVFEWDDIGYVKDDEKNNLDGNAIMNNMKTTQESDNAARRTKGWPTLELVGWEKPPFYDPQTHNLIWATRIRDGGPGARGVETINYNSRILGRGGVMSANLIIAPDLLTKELPKYNEILGGYTFLPGQKYAEWRAGDKVAAYGLTALVAGGAAGLAAKSGLLAKFGKLIIAGVVALFAGASAVVKKLFGRREEAA